MTQIVQLLNFCVKRVPANFRWELGRVWSGYERPEVNWPPCPVCGPASHHGYGRFGDGLSPQARAISASFYNDFTDPQTGQVHTAWHDAITQEEVDLLVAQGRLFQLMNREQIEGSEPRPQLLAADVNAIERERLIHDAINRNTLIGHRWRQAQIETACAACEGRGHLATARQREAYEAWEPSEPPHGLAYQMWETTSEGSPISPPFLSKLDLAYWLASNQRLATERTGTVSDWLHIIEQLVSAIDIHTEELV